MFVGIEDPVAVRVQLAEHKRLGVPFERAWLNVTGPLVGHGDGLRRFMERHFKAAYNDAPSLLGRLPVERTDESQADPWVEDERVDRRRGMVAAVRLGHSHVEVAAMFGVSRQRVGQVVAEFRMDELACRVVSREGRCRSGDGCDRARGFGRTGLFCEHHAEELSRIDAQVVGWQARSDSAWEQRQSNAA